MPIFHSGGKTAARSPLGLSDLVFEFTLNAERTHGRLNLTESDISMREGYTRSPHWLSSRGESSKIERLLSKEKELFWDD